MKLRIITILAFIVALSACKKDDIESFPHVLKLVSVNKKSDVRVYINGGTELNDKAALTKYLATWPNIDASNYSGAADAITFTGKDSVTFGVTNLMYSVQKTGDQFLFYSRDTYPIYGMESIDPYIIYKAEAQPIPSGNGFAHVRKDVKVGHGKYNNLKLSFMLYKIAHGDGRSFYSMAQGGIFNEFNKSSLSNLKQGDTLAVQEYTLNFKK